MQIEVLQPRPVLFGETVLLPGVNDCSPEFVEEIERKRGFKNTIARLSKDGRLKTIDGAGSKDPATGAVVRVAYNYTDTKPVLRVLDEPDPKAKRYVGGESLAGLSDDAALRLIEASRDPKELERWSKAAKSKAQREAIAVQIELIKMGGV